MLSGGREIDLRTLNNDYKKIKIGVKNLDDAVLNLGEIKRFVPNTPFYNKGALIKAILENDVKTLRDFSRFYYKTNGIYAKLC